MVLSGWSGLLFMSVEEKGENKIESMGYIRNKYIFLSSKFRMIIKYGVSHFS